MKSPIWEASTGALMALLFPTSASPTERNFAYFDLYTISCVQGPVLRYTTCDRDVGYSGTAWSGNTVRIEPADQRNALFHAKIGLDVDSWQAVFYPRPVDDLSGAAYPDTIGSTPWLAAAATGALDGAIVTVDRAYFGPAWPPAPQVAALIPVGVLRIFAGRVAEVDLGRTGACVTINSHLELLNNQMPRNLFQAPCRHRLFDAGCTLSAGSFAVSGTVTGGSRYAITSAIAAPGGSGTYTLGRVVFTSGLNNGFARAVRSWAYGVNIAFISPLPFAVTIGDAFTAYPGCDKTFSSCTLFSNTANYGGQPFIPAPETAS